MKMVETKVFVVIYTYSWVENKGVFSSMEKADAYAKKKYVGSHLYKIEEWELDAPSTKLGW